MTRLTRNKDLVWQLREMLQPLSSGRHSPAPGMWLEGKYPKKNGLNPY